MKTNVLKSVCAVAAMLLLLSCNDGGKKKDSQNNENAEQLNAEAKGNAVTPKSYPWSFPESIPLDLELGQYVLSIHTFYPNKLKNSKTPANDTYIFYNAKVDSVGKNSSKVGGVVMPNSLIIPIPRAQKVKKGDIVLTWWQSGSGMQRAIVKDDSNPEEPIVDFLDLKYEDNRQDCLAIKFGNCQLKPNSFVKLENGKWQSGMPIVYRANNSWNNGIIIHATADKVLLEGFGGKIKAYDRSVCKLISIKENFKKGDSVSAISVGSFVDGYKIEKIDKAIGRVWVKKNDKVKVLSILEISKDL